MYEGKGRKVMNGRKGSPGKFSFKTNLGSTPVLTLGGSDAATDRRSSLIAKGRKCAAKRGGERSVIGSFIMFQGEHFLKTLSWLAELVGKGVRDKGGSVSPSIGYASYLE